jgi:hypothetical protein
MTGSVVGYACLSVIAEASGVGKCRRDSINQGADSDGSIKPSKFDTAVKEK